jgi:phage terminase large subunit
LITIHSEPETKKDKNENVIEKRPYTLGGDTAGLGDDSYTAKVVTNDTQKTVATLKKQRIDEDKYADQLYCLGMYYHTALIGVETNYSFAPTKELVELDYPNLYLRERVD